MPTKKIPDGYNGVTPYLSINGAAKAIEYYKRAFSATELIRLAAPNGDIMHAEIEVGNSPVMLADSCEETGFRDPENLSGTSVALHLYVENVDDVFSQAVDAGAKVIKPVEDQFYGDRNGILEDPFGHFWFLSTHIEDLSAEEVAERAKDLFGE